jgi:hypothetical protein
MAQLDFDEHQMECFLAYRGNPLKRTSMEFLVKFCDGDIVWLPWSKDLFSTVQYEAFCKAKRELEHLLLHDRIALQWLRGLAKQKIEEVSTGDVVYVDLRSYGPAWYDTLSLPDLHTTSYYVRFEYQEFDRGHTKIRCFAPVFSEYFWVTNEFVYRYGAIRELPTNGVLVTQELANSFPAIKPTLSMMVVRYMSALPSNFVLLRKEKF